MSVHRIYDPDLPSDLPIGSAYVITGDEASHGVLVKRLRVGEEVEIVSGAGIVARGEIAEVHRKPARMVVRVRLVEVFAEPSCSVVVASAIPKGGRSDVMVDQLSQVGVTRWVPMLTARGVVDPREGKLEKWRRAAVESMKQSGRRFVMEIGDSVTFVDILQRSLLLPRHVLILAHQDGVLFYKGPVELLSQRLGECCEKDAGECGERFVGNIMVLVGPEGGFTPDEIDRACQLPYGADLVSFSPHTLRIETAAVVAAGMVTCQVL